MNANRREKSSPSGRQQSKLILAVDIGGTKVEAGLIDRKGKIIASERRPMVVNAGASQGLRAVRETLDLLMEHQRAPEARAIGVAVPGWVNADAGKVLEAANLPCWRQYFLAKKLGVLYDLPTRIANDADAATMAEAKWGAGRRYRSFLYVSMGTGIGTGIAQKTDGVWRTNPSEGGHMTIDYGGPLCPCGKRGCIEMYASGKAIARIAKHSLAERGAGTPLPKKILRSELGGVTAEFVGQAAAAGNGTALGIIEDACDCLAVWLGNVIDLLEPEAIVIGGGLGPLILSFKARIRRGLKTGMAGFRRRQIPLVPAQFGAQSALLGAAALWL